MKKLFITLGAFFLVIVGLGIFYQNFTNQSFTPETKKDDETYVSINGNAIRVEIVETNADKAKGLSGRKYLGEGDGMLFDLISENSPHMFWMKDMLIPLDIIWITNDKIFQIDANIQPPELNTPDKELEKIVVDEKIDYVLEVNAGYTEANDVKEGDNFQFIKN